MAKRPTTTETRKQAPPPDDGDELDPIEFTRTGWVRLPWDDTTSLRLRRPLFGELKQLRLALEQVSDDITALSDRVQEDAMRMVDELGELDRDTESSIEDRSARRVKLRTESRDRGRALTEFADRARIIWWAQVIDVLCVDKAPAVLDDAGEPVDAVPGWLVDKDLPSQVMQHWRSAPLAPG